MTEASQENNVLAGVKVDPHKGPRANAKKYFALLRASCPFDAVSFGRVTFHKQTYTRSAEGDPLFRLGQVIDLTEAELDAVKKDMQTRVCRLVFGTGEDGQPLHMGQQDVAFARWARPGDRENGVGDLLKGDDGQPLKVEKLVPMPGYEHDPNDRSFAEFVFLREVTAEQSDLIQQILDPGTVGLLTPKGAQDLNATDADAQESIAAGAAGAAQRANQTARKALRGAGVMGRE